MADKVGIQEYVGVHDGFYANIKKRYSDFHVNEISPKGDILHLTSLKIPEELQQIVTEKPEVPEEISELQLDEIKKISWGKIEKVVIRSIDEQTGEKTVNLADAKPVEQVEIDVTDLNKMKRTAIHLFIKGHYKSLDSSTVEIEKRKYIQVKRKSSKANERKSRNKGQKHTHFVMYKENVDTMKAISFLAGILRLRPSNFSYAGTKDKRGITSQAVSVINVKPTNILNACKPIHNVHVGDFNFSSEGLSLGMLAGNQFKIALRDVTTNDEVISKSCESLGSNGFINYYGMQRFGVRSTRTYEIGKELLQYRWKCAIDMILEPSTDDPVDIAKAKELWHKDQKAADAYKILSGRSKSLIEGQLLHGISLMHSNDFIGALQMVPRNTRLMYIHAYQSYVWNKVVSKRIKECGLNVLAGDLIKGKQDNQLEDLENEVSQTLDQKVKHLDDKFSSDLSLMEVVLPLPGHSVIYPNNITKTWYSEILAEDGFNFSSFNGSVTQYTLRGAYRNVLMKPKNFKSEIFYCEDETKDVIQSDIQKMNEIDITMNLLKRGTNKVVLLEFQLPPSAYATMALRELTKTTDEYFNKNKRRCEDDNSCDKKHKSNDQET